MLTGKLTPGELTVFLTYLKTAFKPLRDIAKYTGRIAKASASGERIIDVLDERIEIADALGARPARGSAATSSSRTSHLAYRSGHPVLRGLDFSVQAGQRVAVVGPSGAGKSSLVALLCRLRDPDVGRVRIDGHDLSDLTLASVRRARSRSCCRTACCSRHRSARTSPSGSPEPVTDEQIVAAARLAGAHEFILALPEGYDTVVGERGATLSGDSGSGSPSPGPPSGTPRSSSWTRR